MTYSEIDIKILEVLKICNIKSFPLDCDEIVRELGCKLFKYSELSQAKLNSCLMVSDESMKLHNRIYYNDRMNIGKIRFSIMHELGHIILGHGDYKNDIYEIESNYFASHILAPRMAIHYSGCKNHVHVANQFNLSIEAAQYAFDDYRRWRRRAIYKMDMYDKAMYSHFYNDRYKGFVYSIKSCKFCGTELLNEKSGYCDRCFNRLNCIDYSKNDKYFYAAESNWLYGGIY